jgi:hypothetical protein
VRAGRSTQRGEIRCARMEPARPHAEGATPGRSRGCHALRERNAAGFASIVPRQCSVNSVKGTLSSQKEVRSFADMSREVYVAVALAGLAQLARSRPAANRPSPPR